MYGKTWLCCAFILAAATWGVNAQNGNGNGKGKGKVTRDQVYKDKFKKIPPSEQKKAAQLARKRGLKPGIAGLRVMGTAATFTPGPPHYFGPYGNWAFSPLPAGPVAALTVVDGGSGYSATPTVTITDAYLPAAGFIAATVSAEVENGVITGFTIGNAGAGYMAPVVTITDATGTGALADATIGATLTGGVRKFVDTLPGLGSGAANNLGQYIPVAVPQPCTYSGQAADCYTIGLVEYEEQMHSDLPKTKLRGYVQLSASGTVALTNPNDTPVLMPDGTQAKAVEKPHYLGPVIVARGKVAGLGAAGAARPVRITFYNLLPNSTSGGNLPLPVDETVMGAGHGPALPGSAGDKYTQNRATVHLHGNNTVWISDGNTHQWITPADEITPYPKGVSTRNVPDMKSDGVNVDCDIVPAGKNSSGCMTFFYTNAQSARLQFYHDHAHGITRLNVYAGEAAGYVVTDAVEQDMIAGTNNTGVNPGLKKVLPGLGIPLIIQDKTFVDARTIYAQDPTWAWGSGAPGTAVTGDFWYPHVYMPVTNPFDPTGTNAFGRWFYGPWFNPPTPVCVNGGPVGCIENGPVPNPYAGTAPWEPPMNPGVPNPSIPGESFLDTPIVNGTAYPVLKVEPKAYRFRILNAANDRAQNLQLYVAADKTADTTASAEEPAPLCTGVVPAVNCTEVRMVPVSVAPANQYADTPSGIPDPSTAGPKWIQIGTEGGFTPAPVVIPQQPIGYNLDPAYFNFGIVNQHSLFLMPAERADVIVDFSNYAGRTLILYNDSPAPVPAGAAPYDNYTGNGNQMDSGGAPNTQPGYGPNTRTIMQIQIGMSVTAGTETPDVRLDNLQAVFAKTPAKRGVFEVSQDPIVIPQKAYGTAYGNQSLPSDATQYILNVADKQKSFQPLGYDIATNAWNLQPSVTIPFQMKAMHDEMGGVYDTEFGRMSGMLGLSNPLSNQGFVLPFPFASPPTDVVKGSLESTKIGQLADGTQIWRIFHAGVDTHPIHTHLFTAQVIARVGQDGQVAAGPFPTGQPVDAQNQGWKDTFYVNPLEITFLALRPTVPTPSEVPFELPNSKRLIDPMLPAGATLLPPSPAGWFDPNGNPIRQILNHVVNFGWEYVWHCHILSHEEMDFMHSLVFAAPPMPPTGLVGSWNGNANSPRISLNWVDKSSQEAGFTVQRALDANFTTGLTTVTTLPAKTGAGTTVTYTDTTPSRSSTYYYRVLAKGEVVGDVTLPAFPTTSADSVSNTAGPINTFASATAPAAPTNLTATAQAGPQVRLTWRDNANNESGFKVERCSFEAPAATCNTFASIAAPGPNTATYSDATVTSGNSYLYRVAAFNAAGDSAFVTLATAVVIQPIPPAPTSFTVSAAPANGNNVTATLVWSQPQAPANFTIQRANNLDFTTGLTSFTVAGTATTLTQTVNRNTVYYYRIRANNNVGDSSAWTKALPFPIRTP